MEHRALRQDTEKGLIRLWSWALPLLLGLTVGWLCMTCFEVWLEVINGRSDPVAITSDQAISGQETDVDNLAAFLITNPFKVTPRPGQSPPEPLVEETRPPVEGAMVGAVLKGTSPGFMAWMEDGGNLRLIRLGESFDGYTLEEVTYLAATFVRDNERVKKEIAYSGGSPVLTSTGHISYQPERVPSFDDIDMNPRYLGNPFEEFNRIRIIPGGAGQGLKVNWLGDESILARIGVEKDDVIREINGKTINSLMDIGHALDSSEDPKIFIVEVTRGDEPATLEYYVR